MQPADVETVRELLGPQPDFEVDEEWASDEHDTLDDDAEPEPEEDPAAELEEEISRLESEIAVARQRRQALERYLEEMEIRDRGEFEREVEELPEMGAMLDGWYSRVTDQVIVYGEEVRQD